MGFAVGCLQEKSLERWRRKSAAVQHSAQGIWFLRQVVPYTRNAPTPSVPLLKLIISTVSHIALIIPCVPFLIIIISFMNILKITILLGYLRVVTVVTLSPGAAIHQRMAQRLEVEQQMKVGH